MTKIAVPFIVVLLTCGCNSTTTAPPTEQPRTESHMRAVASKECMFQVLKSIDRPFESKPETGSIWIDAEDPILAQCVMYCTHSTNGEDHRSLFLVTFHNDASPEFASSAEELRCVLVNRDGTVVFKDDEYWHDDTHEELLQAGAADSDGPPFIATGILELAEINEKYATPGEGE